MIMHALLSFTDSDDYSDHIGCEKRFEKCKH